MKSYRRQTRWVSRSCIKNTAHVRYSVRENSTSWRKFDGSADTWLSQAEFRVSCRVPTASPPRWRSAKPAIVRVFYPGTDTRVIHVFDANGERLVGAGRRPFHEK